MITTRYTFFIGLILFAGSLFSTFPSLGQKNKKKEKQEKNSSEVNRDDERIHLRIEKYENGERNVYERTYRNGDSPDLSKELSFNPSDSIISIKITRGISKDSTYGVSPDEEFSFNFDDMHSKNYNFSFNHNLDSLLEGTQQMMFELNNKAMPDIDSLVRKSLEASEFAIDHLNKNFQFHFDTPFNNENFDFQWYATPFNFDGDDVNMMLDKDLYTIEEVEKDGKKMIKITPKEKETKKSPRKKDK